MINTSSSYLEYLKKHTVLHFPIKDSMHLFAFNNILFYYYAIFIICIMSQYLNGLSYVITQLCDCYTSIPTTLALQHRTCILQFSNIVCHKIFQY